MISACADRSGAGLRCFDPAGAAAAGERADRGAQQRVAPAVVAADHRRHQGEAGGGVPPHRVLRRHHLARHRRLAPLGKLARRSISAIADRSCRSIAAVPPFGKRAHRSISAIADRSCRSIAAALPSVPFTRPIGDRADRSIAAPPLVSEAADRSPCPRW
jgi:hypothetical protein